MIVSFVFSQQNTNTNSNTNGNTNTNTNTNAKVKAKVDKCDLRPNDCLSQLSICSCPSDILNPNHSMR